MQPFAAGQRCILRALPAFGIAAALATSVLTARPLSAQPLMVMPNGTEFQVSTYTSDLNLQFGRTICHDGDGNFVVVWQGGSFLGQGCGDGCPDGEASGIFARRYDSNGAQVGTEFQVNSYTIGAQGDPAVCCSADGDFVVAWSGPYPIYPFFAGGRISGQRFASTGAFLGTEFQISQFSSLNDFGGNPDICCSAGGDFVVTWNELPLFIADDRVSAIVGQRYASDGSPQGTEFQVAGYTSFNYVLSPGVCCDAAGDFVVAWSGGDYPFFDVFAQRYASSGSEAGTEFQVNTYTSGLQGFVPFFLFGFLENQAICCDTVGDFVVSWTSVPQDGSSLGIFGQRFASGGQFRGTEFQVNSVTSGYQINPAICCGPLGDFVIVWTDGSYGSGITGQRYSSAGARTGREFDVTSSLNIQGLVVPSVSCDPAGGFVVTWFDNNEATGGVDIFGQRFKLAAIDIPLAPALSWMGLAAGVVALLGTAARGLRRRR